MTGFDPTQDHSGATADSSIPVDRGDEESNSTSEDTAPDTIDLSGHIRPSEIPTAEVITVPDDSDFSVDAPVLNSYPVTLTSSVPVTMSPSSVEVEASSPEIFTFIPESNASSGAEPLEDIQGKLEQEGLGENPEVFLSKTQNITDSDLEVREKGNNQTSESYEESGGSSGDIAEMKPELLLTSPTLSTDTGAPSSGVKVTLIPRVTVTPGWEQSTSPSTPQESRSDREHRAEPPVTKEPDDSSKERKTIVGITSSSINGELLTSNQKHMSVNTLALNN